jgi:outer membrane protein OmpA-like peptidoglycan-associated protein
MHVRFSRFEIVTGTGALFLCLVFVCVFMEAAAIQAQVGSGATRAVVQEDLYWVAVEPQGQHVVITGAAADPTTSARAAQAAARVPGVTGVTNRIRVLGSDGHCQRRLDDSLIQHSIGFRSGRTELSDTSYPALEAAAEIMRRCGARFEIAAHTALEGDAKVNQQLSQRRAETVMRQLVAHGVDPARLTAVGYGARQWVATRHGDAEGVVTGRLEFRILGDDA